MEDEDVLKDLSKDLSNCQRPCRCADVGDGALEREFCGGLNEPKQVPKRCDFGKSKAAEATELPRVFDKASSNSKDE